MCGVGWLMIRVGRRERERLRDDREVRSRDAPAEDEIGERGRRNRGQHEDRGRSRTPDSRTAPPPPRQRRSAAPLHEVGQRSRIGAREFEVHRDRVAAEREEHALPETQDAAGAPDQGHAEREDRHREKPAEQRELVGRQIQGCERGYDEKNDERQLFAHQPSSNARELCETIPRGLNCMNAMTAISSSTSENSGS